MVFEVVLLASSLARSVRVQTETVQIWRNILFSTLQAVQNTWSMKLFYFLARAFWGFRFQKYTHYYLFVAIQPCTIIVFSPVYSSFTCCSCFITDIYFCNISQYLNVFPSLILIFTASRVASPRPRSDSNVPSLHPCPFLIYSKNNDPLSRSENHDEMTGGGVSAKLHKYTISQLDRPQPSQKQKTSESETR